MNMIYTLARKRPLKVVLSSVLDFKIFRQGQHNT